MKKRRTITAMNFLSAALVVTSIFPVVAFAQVTDANPNPALACVSITHNLGYGSHDYQTGGDVSSLQFFLQSKGYFNSNPTGYFGPLTRAAVESFQSVNDVSNTGYVGPITRAKISTMCENNPVTPISSPISSPNLQVCSSGALFNLMTGARCSTSVPNITVSSTGTLQGKATIAQPVTQACPTAVGDNTFGIKIYQANAVVKSLKFNTDGTFSIDLPPGTYMVYPDYYPDTINPTLFISPDMWASELPQQVTIQSGLVTTLNLSTTYYCNAQ